MTLPSSIVPRPNIELPHHRIHEGNHFMTHRINSNVTVPKYFFIIPPPAQGTATIQTHFIFEVNSDNGIKLELFEGGTVSSNGKALSTINSNRNSSTISLVQIYEDPTVTNDGTSIFEEQDTKGGTVGSFDRDEEEIILMIGTNYLLKITPLSPSINTSTELNWYDARPSSPIPIPPAQ